MTGHLFIHLGPPKTATTALQYVLQDIDVQSFAYLGVHQPRRQKLDNASRWLHGYSSGAVECDESQLAACLQEISRKIDDGITLVLSEEMFLVWQHRATFWEKLDRLETLLQRIPHTYLLTLREPAQALESYYQELYRSLSFKEQREPARFFEHERCDCYDYCGVIKHLEKNGCRVRTIEFQAMVNNEFTLDELLDWPLDAGFPIALRKENVARKAAGGDGREFPAITVSSLLRRRSLTALRATLKRVSPAVFCRAKNLAERIEVVKPGKRMISIPQARLKNLQRSYEAALLRSDIRSL